MFIYLVCVGVSDCVCHESTSVHGLQERVLDPQQLELTGTYELPDTGAGNWTQVPRVLNVLLATEHLSSP